MNRKHAWITTATDESTAKNAAILSKSLQRNITLSDVHCVISEDLNCDLRKLLSGNFDSVIQVNLKEKCGKTNLSETDLLKIFACHLDMYDRVIIIDPNSLVLKNCDELFEMVSGHNDPMFNESMVVMQPASELLTELNQLALNRKYNSFFEVFSAFFDPLMYKSTKQTISALRQKEFDKTQK